MSQADVRSIEDLREFRASLATFAEDVLATLGTVDMEIRRTTRWLTEEQRMYWEAEIKRRKEKVSMARSELARRKLSGMFGHTASSTEQKDILEDAEKRLRDGEARASKLKKWAPVLQQAVLEYKSNVRRLIDMVGGDVPKSMAQLERLIAALEAYTQVAPPTGFPRAESSAGPGGSMASGGVTAPPEGGATDPPTAERPAAESHTEP